MSKLRALKTEEEISAVPLNQPVLVELPASMSAVEVGTGDDNDDGSGERQIEKTGAAADQDDGAKRLESDLASLKDQLAQSNARADEAIRVAADRDTEVKQLRERSQSDETALINNGLTAAQSERDAAKAAFESAFEAGDAKRMADAQSKIGRAEASILHFESGAAEIADRKPEERRRTEAVRTDFATSVRANPNLMQTEKDWMIQHQDNFKDPDFNRRLDSAYAGAVSQPGLVRGSPEYFDFIETKTGLRKSERSSGNERDFGVSAPPSRNERGGDGRPLQGRVMLSSEEREMARSMGVSEIEYARQKVNFENVRKADPEKYRGN